MHNEILSKEQSELLLLIQQFNKSFYLVGGTAIALHIGHRRSIDFDLFSVKDISLQATGIFKHEFNEKLFREQLAFHKDIDYSEPIEYIVPAVNEEEIKAFLIEKAIDIFN